MKKFVLASILMASLPFLVWAQSADDLYYIPKKKVEKKVEKKEMVTSVPVNTSLGSTVVVKDAKGDVRDVDEYNRRYTSRENTFSIENDTLYIEEKPYDEQGEWVNGFDGSETDYEYAMRIVRFRNPRFAIPVSSPLYWDVLYTLPSWEWNVYDDGFYAYAFPTYSNPLWWNWRFNYSWSWGWSSPWHYSHWYGPGYWHHSYWHHHHHYYPHYGWGGGHGWNGSSARNPGIHAGRYQNNNRVATGASNRRPTLAGNRTSRDAYLNRTSQNDKRNGSVTRRAGRVVKSNDASSSVRPQRNAVRSRNQGTAEQKENASVRSRSTYTRPAQGKSSTYDRQSSTRTTVKRTTPTYQKKSEATERNSYQSRSSRSSESRSDSYNSSRSSSSSSSGSYSSGSSSSRSSGFGSSRSSGGGGSRGGGRR